MRSLFFKLRIAMLPLFIAGTGVPVSAEQPKEVIVVNPSTKPVPVVGTTTVTGTATISGDVNATITGTPTVTVGNAATNPVHVQDMQDLATNAFQLQVGANMPGGSGQANSPFSGSIPSGKRFVIESISAISEVGPSEKPWINMLINMTSGNQAFHNLVLSFQSIASPFDLYQASSQATKIYVDSDTVTASTVNCHRHPAGATSAACSVTFSGYLVNKP
jgi:hypothetical protein